MKAEEMWAAYQAIRPEIGDQIDAWAFGDEADQLADLVLQGVKTVTVSSYNLHVINEEPLPQVGTFDVILDSRDQAVCIVEMTKVTVMSFEQVSAEHAYKEGEGDRSLSYWRRVHQELFSQWLAEEGLDFTGDSRVVLEEFRLVYPPVIA